MSEDETDVDWSELSVEERAQRLFKVYCSPRYDAAPGQVFDLNDGKGLVWRKLTITHIVQSGIRISAMDYGWVLRAVNLLRRQGLLCTRDNVHYVRLP